jgi:ATP-dependent DNA helicase RecG
LPNNLTVEKIRTGISNIRNPILVSYIAKGLLPYHGLGSGIKRALDKWPDIEFTDDHDRCLFIATDHRKPVGEMDLVLDSSEKASVIPQKTSGRRRESVGIASGKILDACRENGAITIPELAALIGITERSIERNIQSLRKKGLLRRVGGRKEGRWEVVE